MKFLLPIWSKVVYLFFLICIRFTKQKVNKQIVFSFFFIKKVTGVAKRGGYRYDDGTRYIGDWNSRGQKHGMGHLILAGKF